MTKSGLVVLLLVLVMSAAPVRAATLLVPAQYATIQEAVDAAVAGDEVVISAGVYVEQVVITKDLTLTGAGIGLTVLKAPVSMPHMVHAQNYNAVIHAEAPAVDVALRDFSVDGAGLGQVGTRFTGIMFDRAGGSVERIEIHNLHETPISDATSGIGLYSYSQSGDNLGLLVDGLVITNFQKSGFVCFGNGSMHDVRNTLVDASGLYSDSVQNGFEMLNGTSGSLTNCTSRLIWYDGFPYEWATSCGFLAYYAETWILEGCQADQNQSGIYDIATDLDLRGVTVASFTSPLNINYGVVATGPSGPPAVQFPGPPDLTGGVSLGRPIPLMEGESALATELATIVKMDNCSLTGNKSTNELGLVAYSAQADLDLTVENSTFTDWWGAILTSEAVPGWVVARARSNWIHDNLVFGVAASTSRPFDARGNNWGDPSGPLHVATNPSGMGDEVSDQVIFDPWLKGNVICGPVPQYISQSDDDGNGYSRELTVRYMGGGTEPVYGFSIELTWDKAFLTASANDVSRPESGLFQNATLFHAMEITSGVRVDGALGGGQSGADAGSLFTVRFHLVEETDYQEIPVQVKVFHLRDNQNQEISGWTENNGLVIGDVVAPVIGTLALTNISLPHTNQFAKNGDMVKVVSSVTDGDPLLGASNVVGDFVYLLGLDGWMLTADSYALGTASWSARSSSLVPSDGPVPYGVTVTDPAGNTSTAGDWILADNTPPQPVTGLMAESDHNQISLNWNDPTGLDANLRQVVVRSNPTNDYPNYTDPGPGFPADPDDGEGVFAGMGSGVLVSYAPDGSERDIAYLQVFAVDEVNLYSVATSESQVRRPNYVLADVTGVGGEVYDGSVDIYDVTLLGDTYGLAPGAPDFNGECDVGPTDDGTTGGVPEPDGAIGLDDLMIFADAYDRDLDKGVPVPALVPGAGPELAWRSVGDGVWALELLKPCEMLKGLRLVAEISCSATVSVSAGDLLKRQAGPYFLHALQGRMDVSIAVLGSGVGVDGTGELIRLESNRAPTEMSFTWDARGLDNSRLVVRAKPAAPPLEVPSAFALHGSHPNPFNPATTIVFDLPSSQHVEVVVYGLDGRRVAKLLEAPLEAGRRQVSWRGCDDRGRAVAAGLYIYRVQAGPWSATGKVTLAK